MLRFVNNILNNTPKHDAARVWLMYSALSSLGFTLTFTVNMVYMAETVGLNPLQLVLVGTVLELACFTFEIPTGVVADVYSRRLSVLIGSAMIGAGFIVEGAFPLFVTILISQILWGIGATFQSGAGDAWLADEIGEDKIAPVYLRASQIGNLAAFFGIIASVALATLNIQAAVMAGGVIHLLTALYLLRFMPERGFQPKPKAERETFKDMRQTFSDGLRVIRASPVLILLIAITFVTGAFSESFDRLNTAHLLTNFEFPLIAGQALPSVIWFGGLSMIGLLFGASITEIVRRVVKTDDSQHLIRALRTTTVLMVTAVLVFALAENLLLVILALFAVGALRGVYYPLRTTWANQRINPQVRATVLSTVSQVDAFGQIAGGPVFGAVGTVFNIRVALALGAAVLAPSALLYPHSVRQNAAEQHSPPHLYS